MSSLRARAFQWIPERLKEPFRGMFGLAHPGGLSASERRRLRSMPRFQQATVRLLGRDLTIVDAASFLASHHEIFECRQYAFRSGRQPPCIIDVGANIGLASLYFHRTYPGCRITAIESDPAIHAVLSSNLREFGVHDARIVHAAAWINDGPVQFHQDHADAGRITAEGSLVVPGMRLRDLLTLQPVDLLKIDVEGAEVAILEDCEPALANVDKLFVEYHSQSVAPQQLSNLLGVLERSGFRYYIRQTGVHSERPLERIEQEAGFDLQLNVFAVRDAIR